MYRIGQEEITELSKVIFARDLFKVNKGLKESEQVETKLKKIFETVLDNEKVVLIENEFGEISVDSMFLADSKIDIAELSQGCICCSLVGDFARSLDEVIKTYKINWS